MLQRDVLAGDHLYPAVMARQRISDVPLPQDVDAHIPRVHRIYRGVLPDLEPMFRCLADNRKTNDPLLPFKEWDLLPDLATMAK